MGSQRRELRRISVAVITVSLVMAACGDDDGAVNDNQNSNVSDPICGNHVVETGEDCDEGINNSDVAPNACRTNCRSAQCGDGVIDASEICDTDTLSQQSCAGLGYTKGTLACSAACDYDESDCTTCGDGVAEGNDVSSIGYEMCDGTDFRSATCTNLGHAAGVLRCTNLCTINTDDCVGENPCGNGYLDAGEECDDATANTDAPNVAGACRTDCMLQGCGDNIVDNLLGEQCDTGHNLSDTPDALCRTDCTLRRCGDGVTDPQSNEECDDANAVDWDGCTACEITEFRVNSETTADQHLPRVAVSGDGTLVVVWTSVNQDGSGTGVYAQLFDGLGTRSGPEFRVNSTTNNGQYTPDVAMAPGGRFVVTWAGYGQGSVDTDILARPFSADGSPLGGEILVNTTFSGNQGFPRIAMAADGDFVISYSGGTYNVLAKRFDSAGNPVGVQFGVEAIPGGSIPGIAAAADGRFVVAFEADDAYSEGIFARVYTSAGVPLAAPFMVNTFEQSTQRYATVGMAADGSFTVAWESLYHEHPTDPDFGNGVYVQRFDASGIPVGSELLVNTETHDDQYRAALAMAPDGRFVVVWSSLGQDGSSYGIYAQRFSSTGVPQGSEFRVNAYTVDAQHMATAAMQSDGSFVVAWASAGQDGDGYGVYAQRFTSDGTPLGVGQ